DFFKRKEQEFIQEADYTISLTEKGKDIIHSWNELAGQPVPIKVIPCCADLNHFSKENIDINKRTEIQRDLGITPDDLVLTYLGSIGTWYMLPEMLDFFQTLLSERPNSKL